MKVPLGKRTDSMPGNFSFEVPENTDENKTNIFFLGKQGIGKTNLCMESVYFLYELYLDTKGKYGCIPIVFAPTFEWTKMRNKTNSEQPWVVLPPGVEAVGIEASHFAFHMANVPDYLTEQVTKIRLDFEELTTEDIGVFANMSDDLEALGKIEKNLEALKKDGRSYTIEEFLEKCAPDKPLYNSLYYMFKKLKEEGMFDKSLKKFSWEEALRARKPIVFNFGEIDERNIYQAIAGILLRDLFTLSNKYLNAKYKLARIQEIGDPKMSLSADEQWFIDNFVIGLFFEEAHQFFPPTTTKVLKSFPASAIFKKISMQLGRKRNFKYNFLISQRLELLFKEFRTEVDWILLGSKVDATDREMLEEIIKRHIPNMEITRKIVNYMAKNDKYCFSMTNMNQIQIYKFKAYAAPCGQ